MMRVKRQPVGIGSLISLRDINMIQAARPQMFGQAAFHKAPSGPLQTIRVIYCLV